MQRIDPLQCQKELMQIPGVGKRIAFDFWEMGIESIADLRGKNPDELYLALCKHQGYKVDRCMLYVFRCAVYFAETKNPSSGKLKWWYWKDK